MTKLTCMQKEKV